MKLTQYRGPRLWPYLLAVALSGPAVQALPIITEIVEIDGDAEATDTIVAQFTGQTFVNGVENEPVAGSGANDPYTVGLFVEDAPMFVDRNHQWNGATTSMPIPSYLLGGEYIMSGNDNRDNPTYQLEVTISEESFVYMLIDDRMGDGSNANPPNFPDWTGDRSGDGLPDMGWIVEQGWEPVKNGLNRFNNPDWPDQVGADEGGDGVGPGNAINQWSSIYVKRIPAGKFTLLQPDNSGQNMYGVVVKPVPRNPFVVSAIGDIFGVTFRISDGAQTPLDTNSLTLTLDGAPVTVSSVTKDDDVTTVVYTAPEPFASESAHVAVIVYADNAAPVNRGTNTLDFTVERYVTVPPSWKVTDVDTTQRGFLVRAHQLEDRRHILGNQGGRIAPAEQQLAGRLGPNVADTNSFTSNGYFPETSYINYNADAAARGDTGSNAGLFGTSEPVKPENPIPGIPGMLGSRDHAVVEVLAYVELPAGFTTMGVNSDDGFRLSISRVGALADKLGVNIVEFDADRGSASTEGRIFVQEAGIYAMRLMFFQGGGGFNGEWYVVQPDQTRILINDPDVGSAPKAYTARTGPEPSYVIVADPPPSSSAVAFPDDAIHIEIANGSPAVESGSVSLKVNGQAASPTISQSGGNTVIDLNPPSGIWPAGSLSLELSYTAGTRRTNVWATTIMSYVTLEECLRTPVGSGQNPGMRWRVHQLDQTATRANSVAAAEAQLADQSNNAADLSAATGGYFDIDYVNFEQAATPDGLIHDGQLPPRNAPELPIPGIPGLGTVGNNLDNITGEATAFIEFPQAGMYYMGINRDDGFRLTVASSEGGRSIVNGPNVQQLGVVEPGGGIDDNNVQNFIAIHVPEAGVWPLRLLWFEGSGGASIEWYQTDKRAPIGLINDPYTTTTLRAFRTRTASPAATNAPACSQAVAPTIAVSRSGGNISIQFTGTLEHAAEVTGPFTEVSTTSPHNVTPGEPRRFYRARQ